MTIRHADIQKLCPMPWSVVPLAEWMAAEICSWRYEPPYDIFNWNDWQLLQATESEFGNPDIRRQQYAGAIDAAGSLVGFVQYYPMDRVLRLGLGMKPELCSLGLSQHFLKIVLDEGKKRAPHKPIDLEVLAWNIRAYRAYEKAGFRYEQTYERMTPTGMASFHCMVFDP